MTKSKLIDLPWWLRPDAKDILWKKNVDPSLFSGPNYNYWDDKLSHFCHAGGNRGIVRIKIGASFICCNRCGVSSGKPTMELIINKEDRLKYNKNMGL